MISSFHSCNGIAAFGSREYLIGSANNVLRGRIETRP